MKKVLLTIASAIFLLGNSFAQSSITGYYNNHEYKFVQSAGINGKAAKEAIPAGWYLATITSAEEQAFIESEVSKLPALEGQATHYFIGATGQIPKFTWIWSWDNGENWGYSNWAPNEPASVTNQTALAIRGDMGWKWNNIDFEGDVRYTAGYILEKTGISKNLTFQNSEYVIIQNNGVTYEQALASVPEGWHLATVTSAEEQAFLAGELAQLPHVTFQPDHYFIGAIYKDGAWTWSNGEKWDYSNWGPGEPSGTQETIGAIRESLGTNPENNWKWNNVYTGPSQSDYFAGYILERNVPASISIYSKDDGGDNAISRNRLLFKNEGTQAVSNFKAYYYFTAEKTLPVTLASWYPTTLPVSIQKISNGNYAVVYDFSSKTLLPGESIESIVGVAYNDYSAFNKADDYSYINSQVFTKNTAVVVKDANGTIIYGSEPKFVIFPEIKAESFVAYPNPLTISDVAKIKYVLPAGVSDSDVTLQVNKDWQIQYINVSGKNNQEIALPELNRWSLGSGSVYKISLLVKGVNVGDAKLIFTY